MRQLHSLGIVFVMSLAPAIVTAAPPGDQSESEQGQTLDGRAQSQGPNTQSQQNPPSPPPGAPPPYPWGAPTIEVNPQIQVQVNPKLDVVAKPTADADANADAKADAQANPKADAKADVDTDITSEVHMDTASEGGNATPVPVASEPAKVTKVKIIHRAVPPSQQPRPHKPKRRSGFLVAGAMTFGASYIGTAMNGAYIYENCDRAADEGACRQIATKMLIPVAGPFMAIEDSTVTTNRLKLGALGGLQALGAAMTLFGTVRHIRDGNRSRFNHQGVRIGNNTRVAPMAGVTGGGLNMNLRF